MTTLARLFFANAAANPQKLALWCEGETLTYAALGERTARLSFSLVQSGVRPGDHIGVLLHNGPDMVTLMLATADLGAAIVPLNPTTPAESAAKTFAVSDVAHVVAEAEAARGLMAMTPGQAWAKGVLAVSGSPPPPCGEGAGGGGPTSTSGRSPEDRSTLSAPPPQPLPRKGGGESLWTSLSALIAAAPPDARPQDTADPDAAYILTATSGSTGAPKPIVLSQTTKIRRAEAAAELYGVTAADRVLAATPLHHSLAERLVLLPLITGGTSVLMARYSPAAWIRVVEEQEVSFTIAVSSQLARIVDAIEEMEAAGVRRCPTLRCVVSSSALLETSVKEKLRARLSCDLHECYGASEIAIASNLDARRPDAPLASVGVAAPGVEIRILDDQARPLPPGQTGEIACRTTMAFVGYHKQPQQTAAAHADGFFKTGDLGVLDENGWLYFRGRKKELIITGGANVYPGDVEAALAGLPGVAACAAFALPDERLGEIVALAVVPGAGEPPSSRAIRLRCAERLSDEQQPRKIFFLPALPTNAMGKLVRRELPSLVESRS